MAGTGIGGVLATVSETTAQVQSERQFRTLRDLAGRAAEANRENAGTQGDFPNRDSIIRLVGAVLCEINDDWAVVRRYMTPYPQAREEEAATEPKQKPLKKSA